MSLSNVCNCLDPECSGGCCSDGTCFCTPTDIRNANIGRLKLIEERDRYRQHSITLNTVAYRISRALIGGEPQESYTGSPVADVEALIAERDALRLGVQALRAALRDGGRIGIEDATDALLALVAATVDGPR